MPVIYTEQECAAIDKLRAANCLIEGCSTRMFYKGERFKKRVLEETSIALFDVHGLRRLITISEYLADPGSEGLSQASSSMPASPNPV